MERYAQETLFGSWSRVLSLSKDDDVRLANFRRICGEAVGHIGLERGEAVDELLELADSHGLIDEIGRENIEAIIFKAFEPDPEDKPKSNGGNAQALRQATPYVAPKEYEIMPRAWLHAGHYIRQAATATVAPGGFGKTTLTIHEAIEMVAAGLRVWYLSGEDPRVEIDRRIAAHCKRHKVELDGLAGKLFVDDKASFPLTIATGIRQGVIKFDDASLAQFEHAIVADKIDVVMLDPFIAFHTVAENDNGSIDAVVKRLAGIAQRTDSNVEISHHVRKPFNGQAEITVDDARGGSSLINAVRSARVINRMTSNEAEQADIADPEERHFYVRVDRGKRNMAPPDKATWFHLVSVYLLNGDNVQALESWEFPKAVKPTDADIVWLQTAMQGRQLATRPRAGEPWIGDIMAEHFDNDDAKWLKQTIKFFVDRKVIHEVTGFNADSKRRQYYELRRDAAVPPARERIYVVPDD